MLPLRLVLDTNIVVSAALKPADLQRTVFLLALTKPARVYLSEPVFAEYRSVLSRAELHIRKLAFRCRRQDIAVILPETMLLKPALCLSIHCCNVFFPITGKRDVPGRINHLDG